MPKESDTRCRLYLITPPAIAVPALFADDLRAALDGGDVAVLQIRLKDVADDVVARTTDVLRPVCQQRGVAVIMNDRPDLAAKLDCDGVHVGQEDSPYAEARRLLGADRIVGVTCHASRHLAMEAAEAGADYVAFGAFFPSVTKDVTVPASIDILAWWHEIMTVPSVAIGGITADNCRPLVEAGSDFLAVANGVWGHPDGPTEAVRRFNAVFDTVVR
ncbi:MAG TPA: thiamine phosphate synthase [Vineibacter sp.]|nr:thiamine phosphate synthase [Vineibacter sp.]